MQDFLKSFDSKKITLIGPLVKERAFFEPPIIYVDGGTHLGRLEGSLAVGDGDSSSTPMDVKLPQEKDESDLAYALKNIPESYSEVQLIGFLGGRRDHEMINLGEVHHFLSKGQNVSAQFDEKIWAGYQLEKEIHGTFSLFSFEENEIELGGSCKYPHSGSLKAHSSLGLSNEGSGKIQLTAKKPIFLFYHLDKEA